MKLIKNATVHFSLVILCAGLAGCMSPNPVTPLGGGYEEKGHPIRTSAEPADMRVSLQYRATDGEITLIWPSLYGVGEVIKGNMAVFVGDLAYVQPDSEFPRGTKPRLFAVQSPALPLDITDEVLRQWSKKTGKDFVKALDQLSMVTPAKKDGRLELRLEFWTEEPDWPDKAAFQLDWNQVSEIMRAVKERGVVRKDPRWGTLYLQSTY